MPVLLKCLKSTMFFSLFCKAPLIEYCYRFAYREKMWNCCCGKFPTKGLLHFLPNLTDRHRGTIQRKKLRHWFGALPSDHIDPEMVIARLPQPYRMLNKIIVSLTCSRCLCSLIKRMIYSVYRGKKLLESTHLHLLD